MSQMDLHEATAAALSAMRQHGFDPPGGVVPDGRIHRWRINGSKLNGFYKIFPDEPFVCLYGDWSKQGPGEWFKWTAKGESTMTPEEAAATRQRIEQARRERDRQRRAEQEAAARRAAKIWESAKKKRNVDVTTDNKEIVVTTKKIIWGDWRDWFFDEED